MKKIVLLFFSVLLTVSVFAQDPGAAEKNAGNAVIYIGKLQNIVLSLYFGLQNITTEIYLYTSK